MLFRSVGPGSGNQFYNTVGDPNAVQIAWDDATNRATWFDKNAFAAPKAGTYATAFEKNFLRQPGFWELNMSFRKAFSLTGSQHLDLRLEAFNILNRVHLGTPDLIAFNRNGTRNPTFGRITDTSGAARQIQLGVKFLF